MSVRYNEEFKKQVVQTYMAGDKSHAEIAAKYNIAKSAVCQWAKQYGEECQYTTTTSKTSTGDSAAEIRRLNQKIKEQ